MSYIFFHSNGFPGISPADTECGSKMTALSDNTVTLQRLGSVELAVESLFLRVDLAGIA